MITNVSENNDHNIISLKNLVINTNNYNSIIECYNNFTKINKHLITECKLKNIIEKLPPNHNIFAYTIYNNIVGLITVIIEQKIIHNGKCVAHIEDLTVDKNYQNQKIGKQLINFALTYANENNCYKCILDCDNNMENYYINNSFKTKGLYMANYFS